jgi:hypothetical protein
MEFTPDPNHSQEEKAQALETKMNKSKIWLSNLINLQQIFQQNKFLTSHKEI